MTAATRTKYGPPDGGRYSVDDTVTDGAGVVWTCVKAGFSDPAALAADRAVWKADSPGVSTSVVGVGSASASGNVASESVFGAIHKTLLTLTDVAQAVVNGTEYQGTKIYTFPQGRILILGCQASLAQKTTSTIASTLNSGVTGAVSLGSVTASSTTLSSTMVDMAPSTAFTSSTTINVAGTAVNPVLAAAAQFDGHTTAIDMFLNSAYATTTDVDADATQTWTGTVRIVWVNLGDF